MRHSLSHVSDIDLLHGLRVLVIRDCATTVEILAHLAEVDARRLYLPAACASLFQYCVRELLMSEDCAAKRIQAARAARKFPALLDAVEDGRLGLSVIGLLAPVLTEQNCDEIIAAAAYRSYRDVRDWVIAQGAAMVRETVHKMSDEHAAPHVGTRNSLGMHEGDGAPQTLVLDAEAKAMLARLQQLLASGMDTRDALAVLKHAMATRIRDIERRRFGKCDAPRGAKHASENPRTIPAEVRRTVVERDGEQCAFVGTNGKRCEERRFLEFDHIVPIADGGTSTTENVRLLCRAHNQHAADQRFGRAFMDAKRTSGAALQAFRPARTVPDRPHEPPTP